MNAGTECGSSPICFVVPADDAIDGVDKDVQFFVGCRLRFEQFLVIGIVTLAHFFDRVQAGPSHDHLRFPAERLNFVGFDQRMKNSS